MKVEFHENFDKDLAKSRDPILAKQIRKLIMRLETSTLISEIPNIKKLSGGTSFYRIRIGDYRVGCIVHGSTVLLVRVMHRREIYRYFP